MTHTKLLTLALAAVLAACGGSSGGDEPSPNPNPGGSDTTVTKPSDEFKTTDAMLDAMQQAHFNYMWDGAHAASGMALERIHLDESSDATTITTGGTGFGIAGLVVAMHRGFITREQGVARLQRIVTFLAGADRFHGVWPHWINGGTGAVVPFSANDDGGDLVESSFLMQGLLIARQYLSESNAAEKQVIDGINELWHGMEFDWYTRGGEQVLYWHWSPNHNWAMNLPITGYNEALVTYVLAAASPTHSVSADCYHQGWGRGGAINIAGEAATAPLFWAHYSWIGLNPNQLSDSYGNYGQLMQGHALANYQYCVRNPKGYTGYGADCWGLTASYSPSGYSAHSPANDLGVIAPTAALSSMPYTPEQSIAAMRHFYDQKSWLWGKYGFYDAFAPASRWTVRRYLAIDQLTIAPMIENYRSGLLWQLFMSCPEVQQGLAKLGFAVTQ